MNRENYRFQVLTNISFTEEEVDQLILFSRQHYDGTCKAAAEHGGILRGLKNYFLFIPEGESKPKTSSYEFTSRELDLLCKITEPILAMDENKIQLHTQLVKLFADAIEKYREINS